MWYLQNKSITMATKEGKKLPQGHIFCKRLAGNTVQNRISFFYISSSSYSHQ